MKYDRSIIYFVGIVIFLFILAMLLRFKNGIILKITFRVLAGGAFIYLFNLAGKYVNVIIPLNPITVSLAGFLEAPGVALIFLCKYLFL